MENQSKKLQIVNDSDIIKDSSLDVSVGLEMLKDEGITEKEIDSIFNIDSSVVNNSEGGRKRKKKSQTEIDDELVMTYVNNPTHENFNKIWERYYYGIKSFAYKFMHDLDMADDMVVQTFTRAWEFKDMYDVTKAKYSTWLYIICRNLCLGEINRKKKDNIIPTDISDMYDSSMLKNSIAKSTDSTQYTVEDDILVANSYSELKDKMYDTSLNEIENLGGTYSKILKMKLVDDLKIREIADILNMNESTVKNYLYKGKETIANIMKRKHKDLYEMYLESSSDEATKTMY